MPFALPTSQLDSLGKAQGDGWGTHDVPMQIQVQRIGKVIRDREIDEDGAARNCCHVKGDVPRLRNFGKRVGALTVF
jgi:hypothetical protein